MFKLQFSTDYPSFNSSSQQETVRILRDIAATIVQRDFHATALPRKIHDTSGALIGSWSLNERG